VNKTARKLRKLFRDPRMFFYDSKVFNFGSKDLVEEVSFDVVKPKLIPDNVNNKSISRSQSSNKLVKVTDDVASNKVPWVVNIVDGKIKFKSIKPQKPEICTLFSISEDSTFAESVHEQFSRGGFKGSVFSVSGEVDDTFQNYITQYKPFTSDWFDHVKCTVVFDGVKSFSDVVSSVKYNVFRVNVITNIDGFTGDLDEYDLIISFIELDSTESLPRVEIVRSLFELESILLDSLIQMEYKKNNKNDLISLIDASLYKGDGCSDVILQIKDDVGSFSTFEEYLQSLVESDSVKNIFATELFIAKYTNFIIEDDLAGMIKRSLIDGVRYNVI